MLIPVPPEDCFIVESGRYKAICAEAKDLEKSTRKGIKKYVRITWELQIASEENIRYMAGKNYEPSLTKGSQLRNDLISWFGQNINVRNFETKTLVGKEATVTVHQIENEGWDAPYCWVAKVEPPNTDDEADDARLISPKNVVCG